MKLENFTTQSEYLPLASVCIRPVANAFRSEQNLSDAWESLNYLGLPDFTKALFQYQNFQKILEEQAGEILPMPSTDGLSLDSLYCRDASIATDHGMILCRMGKPARRDEPADHKVFYEALGMPILGSIEAPGTLEGGDVAWLDTRTLAVGHTYRTNASGIEQLRGLLSPKGVEVITADLPHFRGPSDVFHLMSILSPVDRDLAVVYSPLMPVVFRNTLLDRGFTLVEVPEEEYDTLGCNVLALAPRKCLMAEGNPKTEAALRAAGAKVITYAGSEISLKGGGGPTCLTRPYLRQN
ncbi:dimethylarginine dimethylaminohydrolase family protein [Robiginitalea sp.]|uniref:dimethylarginine dimethylaminohydrolase family protein n=1 Tax=Robiginitalea sp. TaxID=1902411 RepID=UPI003C481960